MVISSKQQNIIIGYSRLYIQELNRLETKITNRINDFVQIQGIALLKPDVIKQDLTLLTDKELQTILITLGKIRCEMLNIESQIASTLEKVDKEIMRRR